MYAMYWLLDGDGNTLLHKVCSAGMEPLVHMLLANGANANAVDKNKQTALHAAAKAGQVSLLRFRSLSNMSLQFLIAKRIFTCI